MVRRCWVNFLCRGVLLIWIIVGQGPIALAIGADGGCLDIFSLIYHFSFLSPSLWETARYRLKYCLEGPLNPEQPTNEFLNEFIEKEHYELLECDTDSLYFALSKENISEAIKPEKKDEYENAIKGHHDDNYIVEPGKDNVWLMRECCPEHTKFDLRTPGLMKKEFEASSMTGLSSKSYVAKFDKTGEIKYSLK